MTTARAVPVAECWRRDEAGDMIRMAGGWDGVLVAWVWKHPFEQVYQARVWAERASRAAEKLLGSGQEIDYPNPGQGTEPELMAWADATLAMYGWTLQENVIGPAQVAEAMDAWDVLAGEYGARGAIR